MEASSELMSDDSIRFDRLDPASPVAIAAMTAYFDELDETFPDGFDPGDTLVADADALRPPAGSFLVARPAERAEVVGDGSADPLADTLGCGGVQRYDDHTGEIKRMWVAPAARGRGLGRRLLARLEDEVLALGYHQVVLDTNDTLGRAIALYARAGYRRIERYNDNPYARLWFAKTLRARTPPNASTD